MADRFAIGLDLGGTDLKAALVAEDGLIARFLRLPTRAAESAEAPLEAIAQAVAELRGREAQAVACIGLGAPGAIHPADGALVGSTPHLPHWDSLPLREQVSARLGCPVSLDNDANLAALAEHRAGAARGPAARTPPGTSRGRRAAGPPTCSGSCTGDCPLPRLPEFIRPKWFLTCRRVWK